MIGADIPSLNLGAHVGEEPIIADNFVPRMHTRFYERHANETHRVISKFKEKVGLLM